MGYRRSKQDAAKARAWREFVRRNYALLLQTGVPAFIYESQDLWDDLLMHGYIDHHEDPTGFYVGTLGEPQREILVEVVARYLAAGFWETVPTDQASPARARKMLFKQRILSREPCD